MCDCEYGFFYCCVCCEVCDDVCVCWDVENGVECDCCFVCVCECECVCECVLVVDCDVVDDYYFS